MQLQIRPRLPAGDGALYTIGRIQNIRRRNAAFFRFRQKIGNISGLIHLSERSRTGVLKPLSRRRCQGKYGRGAVNHNTVRADISAPVPRFVLRVSINHIAPFLVQRKRRHIGGRPVTGGKPAQLIR